MEGFAGAFLQGWHLGTILTIRSGAPFSVLLSGNRSRSGNGGGDADRPDLISGRKPEDIILGGPNRYYDPSAFEIQPAGFLGLASRNFLAGPGFSNWDFSVRKDTPLAFLGESGRLEFRAEFFNFLNHPNFSVPISGRTVYTASGSSANPEPRPTAGQIQRTVNELGRNIQFALKLVF
jgi:hypothetical protein